MELHDDHSILPSVVAADELLRAVKPQAIAENLITAPGGHLKKTRNEYWYVVRLFVLCDSRIALVLFSSPLAT